MSTIPFIAAGVNEDFQKFLACFQREQSVRFVHFANVWKDTKFSFLFCGRESECELLEFTEEVLMIAVGYLMPSHTFQVRAAALYLLYAVYMKQKSKIKAKIRVTFDQWNELQNFLTDIKTNEHHDLHYVYRQLELNHAFHFVCFQKEHAPLHRTLDSFSTESEHASIIRNFIEEGQLNDLQEIHNRYCSVKNSLRETGLLKEADYIAPDLISNMLKKLMDFEEKSFQPQNLGGQDANESNTHDEEIGSRRQHLKKKIMRQTTAASRSRRHRETEIETVSGTSKGSKMGSRPNRLTKRSKINYSANKDHESEMAVGGSKESMPVLSQQIEFDLTI